MQQIIHIHKKMRFKYLLELGLVVGVGIGSYFIARTYDVMELVLQYLQKHETLELDEIITAGLFVFFGLIFFAIRRWQEINHSEKRLRQQNLELQKALDENKVLKGILPICASCKKIRDDHGYWHQVEAYFHENTDVDFSHGLCPDCMKKLYPAYAHIIDKEESNLIAS